MRSAFSSAAIRVSEQRGSRAAYRSAGLIDFNGYFSTVFTRNGTVQLGDLDEIVTNLGGRPTYPNWCTMAEPNTGAESGSQVGPNPMTAEWKSFQHRDFSDFPRAIVVAVGEQMYFLDCPFDEAIDDYPVSYHIILLNDAGINSIAGSWVGLGKMGTSVGKIQVDAALFDPSRRKLLRWDLVQNAIIGETC